MLKDDHRTGGDANGGFYIRTFTGKKFYWETVEDNVYDIHDIAHALSMNCRWTGHVKRFYSVAQHCVYASDQTSVPELQLAALLHDASEAYIHDVPSPLKWYLQQHGFTAFSELEDRVDQAVFRAFGLPWPRHALIKEIDLRMLATENRDLMPKGEERSFMPEPYDWIINPVGPDLAERMFLRRFDEITAEIKK